LFYNEGIKEEFQNWITDSLELDEGNYFQFGGKHNPALPILLQKKKDRQT
jgi:hypothetical protein